MLSAVRRWFSSLRESSPLKEMIRKEGGQWCVYSADGSEKLGCHDTEAAAQAQLAAIEIRKMGEANPDALVPNDLLRRACPKCAAFVEAQGWKGLKARAIKEQAIDPAAVCGDLWFNGTDQQRSAFAGGSAGRGRTEKPPEAWWNDCLAKIQAATPTSSKESGRAPMGSMRFLAEAERDADDPRGSVWDVMLISAGLSDNLDPMTRRPRYYSEAALRKAAEEKVFEGKPAFIFEWETPRGVNANHTPDGVSVHQFPRQKVGWYDDTRFGEAGGEKGLLARLHLVDVDLRQPLVEAWDQGNKNFLELSINAGGTVVESVIDGIPVAEVVEIKVGDSVDLVSEGARGGKLLRLVASKSFFEGGVMNREIAIRFLQKHYPKLCEGQDLSKISDEDLGKLYNAALAEQDGPSVKPVEGRGFCIVAADGTVGECFIDEEAAKAALAKMQGNGGGQSAAEGQPNHQPAATTTTTQTTKKVETSPASTPPATVTESKVDEIVGRRVEKAIAAALWPGQVDTLLAEAKLPADQAQYLRESFLGRVGDRKSLSAEIARTKKLLGMAADASAQASRLEEGFSATVTEDHLDKVVKGLRGSMRECREDLSRDKVMIDKVQPFRSLKRAYQEATGDYRSQGMAQARRMLEGAAFASHFFGNCEVGERQRKERQGRLKEALTVASWAQVLGDALEKERLDVAEAEDLNKWKKLGFDVSTSDNLYRKKRIRIGGYGTVPTIAEGAAYPAAVSPTDQQVQIDLTKRGFTDEVTIEMMLRDQLNMIAELPNRMIRAGKLTLQQDVFNILVANQNLTFDNDVTALFTVAHANINTNALSRTQVIAGIEAMMAQLQYGSTIDRLAEANMPDLLLVDFGQWDQANEIVKAPFEFGTANQFELPSNIKGVIKEVVLISHTTDLNDWFLVNSRGKTGEIIFLDGMEEPEIFVQDMPNVGSMFTADKVTYKLRHWWGRAPLDFRPYYGGIVT